MNRALPRIPWDSGQGYGQGYGGQRSCPCPSRAVSQRLRDAGALDPLGEAAAISPHGRAGPVGSRGTWAHHVSWVLPPPPLQGDEGEECSQELMRQISLCCWPDPPVSQPFPACQEVLEKASHH